MWGLPDGHSASDTVFSTIVSCVFAWEKAGAMNKNSNTAVISEARLIEKPVDKNIHIFHDKNNSTPKKQVYFLV